MLWVTKSPGNPADGSTVCSNEHRRHLRRAVCCRLAGRIRTWSGVCPAAPPAETTAGFRRWSVYSGRRICLASGLLPDLPGRYPGDPFGRAAVRDPGLPSDARNAAAARRGPVLPRHWQRDPVCDASRWKNI